MNNDELTVAAVPAEPLRITVTTIHVPAGAADRLLKLEEARGSLVPQVARPAALPYPPEPIQPTRVSVCSWSPLKPFKPLHANYLMTRRALGAGGRMSIVYICIAAGLASVLWRQYTVPIGVAAGLVVAAIMFIRTGAYREYLAAIADAHGTPPIGEVVRYNLACLSSWIATRWRR